MGEDGRFFGEGDPEWAVSQLAAHAATAEEERRGLPWLVLGGAGVTTALVVGTFALGLSGDADETPAASPPPVGAAPEGTPSDAPDRVLRAPRVTLSPMPQPRPEPAVEPPPAPAPTAPATPQATYVPEPAPAQPPAAPPADPPANPPGEAARPDSNQVGPNRPIIRPIDPDDR